MLAPNGHARGPDQASGLLNCRRGDSEAFETERGLSLECQDIAKCRGGRELFAPACAEAFGLFDATIRCGEIERLCRLTDADLGNSLMSTSDAGLKRGVPALEGKDGLTSLGPGTIK